MDNGRIVKRRTRREVEKLAADARAGLGLSPDGRVSMMPILEQVLYEVFDDYDFRVCEDSELGKMDGLTDDREPIIYLKNSVYLALERGEKRARFTAAHEFGHLLMHCGMPTYRAFSTEYDALYDPERQANVFAGAFLMPEQAFRRCKTVNEAMTTFGVSKDAATCRARILKHRFGPGREILSVKPTPARNKKKGTSKRKSP